MLKLSAACICVIFAVSAVFGGSAFSVAEEPAAAATRTGPTPIDKVKSTPKGELRNPYLDTDAALVEQGRRLYMRTGCNGCHGGGAGGGMCPPLSNDTWVYGGDDDTLFRLITVGSDELMKAGFARKGKESVTGPMMPFGAILQSEDDLWKIITFIRANYRGDPVKKFGDNPATPAK